MEFFALETGQHWEDPAPNEPLLLSVRRRREPQVVPSCAPAPSGSFGPKEETSDPNSERAEKNERSPCTVHTGIMVMKFFFSGLHQNVFLRTLEKTLLLTFGLKIPLSL